MYCTHCGAEVAQQFEFCPKCGSRIGGAPAAQPVAPAGAEFTAPAGCRAQTGHWIGAGWRLMDGQFGILMLFSLVMLLICSLVPIVLQGPLTTGMFIVCWRATQGGRADFGDFFRIGRFFVPSLLAFVVTAVFASLGLLACIVGSFVVTAMYQFTYLFIADRGLDFWPAMKASHAIVKQDYFGFTIFVVVLGLLHVLGTLACLVGVLVTIPLHFMAVTVAYKELVGFASPTIPE